MAAKQQAKLARVGVDTPPSIHELNDFDAWLRDVAMLPPEVLGVMLDKPWHRLVRTLKHIACEAFEEWKAPTATCCAGLRSPTASPSALAA